MPNRRPKDRKARIAHASAEEFSALGYHAVSMEAIAAKVGISAAALYRHYPGKYALFREAVLTLGQQLVESTAFADADDASPADMLHRLVRALVDVTLANRRSGGLYRWEARYLRGDDQAELLAQIRVVHRRIQQPLIALRPTLTSTERWTLSTALLSVIGSIVDHRVELSDDQTHALFGEIASVLLSADLPSADDTGPPPSAARLFAPGAGAYEAVLHAAMVLFNQRGYRETSMEQIAAAVGMPASGIYRYFTGKSDILATALHRAADRISGELSSVIAAVANPELQLLRLVGAYVALSFANPELAYVYYTERVNLPASDQKILRNAQRSTIDSWVRLLLSRRPRLAPAQARFIVHATMALAIDLGRLMHYDNSPRSQAVVRRLMEATLFNAAEDTSGDQLLRITLAARKTP